MKVLFIGGTGTISMAISRLLLSQGHTLYLLNRGSRNTGLSGDLIEVKADINDEAAVAALISDLKFDVVADFIVCSVKKRSSLSISAPLLPTRNHCRITELTRERLLPILIGNIPATRLPEKNI